MKSEIEYLIAQLQVDIEWDDKKRALETLKSIEIFVKTGKADQKQRY